MNIFWENMKSSQGYYSLINNFKKNMISSQGYSLMNIFWKNMKGSQEHFLEKYEKFTSPCEHF